MKKHIFGKVLAAFMVLAVSGCFFNLQGQGEVKFAFLNELGADFGNPDGIGGRDPDAGIEPEITLEFKVDPAGNVELVSRTISTNPGNISLVESWSNSNVGKTAYSGIFGGSFKLILTSNKRLQSGWRDPWHGIGCQGTNQWRIDGGANDPPEEVYFILQGDVGIEFTSIEYIDINYQDGQAHFMIQDHDTKKTWFFENIALPDVGVLDVTGEYNLRYKSDSLTISGDPAVGNNNAGGKLYGLEFNVVAPLPKPPAVINTTPPNGDSLTFNIADDYVIEWDAPMDQAATSAAVTISPEVSNRVDTWSTGDEGDILTLSFDDLEFETWYTVVVGTGALGTNGLNKLAVDTFTFKTLPEPPSVISTFPANLDEEVPIDSPIGIEFSKSMIPDSVEKAISFNPELGGLSFVWNEDNSAVYISSDEMIPSTMYFGTVGTLATDIFMIQMPEPFLWAFTTSIATSVDKDQASGVVIYPNPASDMFEIRGMDVESVRIYGLAGQMVKEVRHSSVVNVSDLETGVYIVTVTGTDQSTARKRMIVE